MANVGFYGIILIAIILAAAAVLIVYQTKIRTGHRQPMVLAKCALALTIATIAAWLAFPDGMTRYTSVCVAVVILARTGYLWVTIPKPVQR